MFFQFDQAIVVDDLLWSFALNLFIDVKVAWGNQGYVRVVP